MMQAQPKFKLGEDVTIHPSPYSASLRGVVTHVEWSESFKEFAYTITLHSHSGVSTAWERDLRPTRDSKAVQQ